MISLLERAAAAAPDQMAIVTTDGAASYAELADHAVAIADGLRSRAVIRFAVVEPDAISVVGLLAGAALAGAEPCQYQADAAAAEVEEQARSFGHTVVISRRTDLGGSLEVVHPADLCRAGGAVRAERSDAQPVMIRTTGTTGAPKGARHDWRVLTRTVANVCPAHGQRWLLAYGPHQFAGIQVMLHALAAQATLVAPFPRQPKDGLRALLEEQVDCVSATPTYWRFLLAEARSRKAELPPLEQVTLGGEASSAALLDDLRASFPTARISQVYASTELGSLASVRDGKPGLSAAVLWSRENPGGGFKIVEHELWARSEAGMIGYQSDPPPPDVAASPAEWHPTGDLVELVGDRIYFRGRKSEVINVGGVKVHPLPVEDRIASLDCVALARVFGRPNPLTGAIVAVEVVPVPGVTEVDHHDVRARITEAVADLPRAWRPRSVRFVDTIETRGGKTIRRIEP